MAMTRRSFLIGLSLLVGGTAAASVSTGLRSWVLDQVRAEFGVEVARSPDAAAFVDDLLNDLRERKSASYWKAVAYFRVKPAFLHFLTSAERRLHRHVVQSFLHSTNFVASRETGEPFAYDTLFDPYLTPCSNQLGAFYAPTPATGSRGDLDGRPRRAS